MSTEFGSISELKLQSRIWFQGLQWIRCAWKKTIIHF